MSEEASSPTATDEATENVNEPANAEEPVPHDEAASPEETAETPKEDDSTPKEDDSNPDEDEPEDEAAPQDDEDVPEGYESPQEAIEQYLVGLPTVDGAEEEEEEEEEEEPFVSIFEILDAPRELPEPVDLTLDHLKQIANELGLINICWRDIKNPEFEHRFVFPDSYLKNDDKEKLLLLYAENFRKQFHYTFPNRKPLFLASDNECGMQKMVCTTLRPTTLPYPQIETWQDCANFIGDQLKYECLETPTLLPNRLYSPHTVYLRKSGHSFELATALCSLLLGLNYNAYVVSGYATQDVTLRIMLRVDSPFPPEKEKEEEEDAEKAKPKYELKPARDLRSKFLLMMAQREVDKVIEEQAENEEARRLMMEEIEKPPFDELYGLRVHSWVLLLPGREIEAPVYIEATTGAPHPIDSPLYCGVESIWNSTNYWVNLQEFTDDVKKFDYDLKDATKWEHLLIGEPAEWREITVTDEMEEEEIVQLKIFNEKHLDIPTPWSLRIYIPHDVLKNRFPNGVKKTWFKRSYVEQFAPYVQEDGLVTKICRYSDFDCTELLAVEQRFENRHDNLYKEVYECESDSNIVTQYFKEGREDGLKGLTYHDHSFTLESNMTISFYHHARYDGLSKLELGQQHLTEHYVDRDDRVYYRHVSYAVRGEPPPGMVEGRRRIVVRILEKFHRDYGKKASDDIATRDFAIVDREIHLKYHYEKGNITASTRDFTKPPLAEMGDQLKFKPELTVGYQAEIGAKPPRQLQLFLLFEQQIQEEEKALYEIRDLEDQVEELLKLRIQELLKPKLDVSLFDREHNQSHRIGMLEREQKEKEHREREVEDDIDYLAPYVERLGNPKKLSYTQAQYAYEKCITDFKQMLVDRANNIQEQFEKLTMHLQDRQLWYVTVQDTIKAEEELQYFDEVNDGICFLHTLEIRMARHKDLSPIRYQALLNYLKLDKRLTILESPPKK